MKTQPLPALTKGLDVLHPETALPQGAVREASNIVILDDGSFQRRPAYTALTGLEGAHSLWRSDAQTRVLVAAESTLYDVTLPAGTVAPLFDELPYEQPVEYCDIGPDVYFTAGGTIRKITDTGLVRRPGVADLHADAPTLTAIAGSLAAGRYGVAYGLTNDLGEESGTSLTAYIDLPDGGGIGVSAIETADDVESVVLYVTAPDGGELYHHGTRPWAASTTITDRTLLRLNTRQYLRPIPGGEIVRTYKGRTYVVGGKWVWVSPALDYGVIDTRGAHYLTFRRSITMFEPVESGIFAGLREQTLFLRGDGPEGFRVERKSARGAVRNSGRKVAADFFSGELAPNRDLPVATWLSEAGMALGRPDGSIVYPHADQLSLSADAARAVFATLGGIKQGIYCVPDMTLGVGGAADLTT